MREKIHAIWVTPLRLYFAELRIVYTFTKGLFR